MHLQRSGNITQLQVKQTSWLKKPGLWTGGDAISGMSDTLGKKFERTRINVYDRVSRQSFVRANQGPKQTPRGHVAAALPRRPDDLL